MTNRSYEMYSYNNPSWKLYKQYEKDMKTNGSYVLSCISLLAINILKQFLHLNDPWDFDFLINNGCFTL